MMMSDKPSNSVNIGTTESPIYVPAHALKPKSQYGAEYWEGIATGSIIVSDGTLNALLDNLPQDDKGQ
jgi:hypothetical protein